MKHLDWKSFAIGILLTTTVVFGVAATNPTSGKQWNEDQKWLIKKVKVNGVSDIVSPKKVQELREETVGWEFVETETASNGKQYIVYKKPVDNWPALPQLKKNDYFYYRDTDLNSIYP